MTAFHGRRTKFCLVHYTITERGGATESPRSPRDIRRTGCNKIVKRRKHRFWSRVLQLDFTAIRATSSVVSTTDYSLPFMAMRTSPPNGNYPNTTITEKWVRVVFYCRRRNNSPNFLPFVVAIVAQFSRKSTGKIIAEKLNSSIHGKPRRSIRPARLFCV